MKFLDKLRGVKTSAEYEVALGEVNASIVASDELLATLKHALRSAPFNSGADEIKAMRQRIRDLEDEIDYAKGVAAETAIRRDQARELEIIAEVDRRMAAARNDTDQLRKLWGKFDAAIAAAEAPLGAIRALHEKVSTANSYARQMGHPELCVSVSQIEATEKIRNMIRNLDEQSQSHVFAGE